MASITYLSIAGDFAPHVPGVPDPVMEAYIRKVVADLCERAKVWRVPFTGQALTAGTYQYTLTSPVAQTETSTILHAKMYLTSAAVWRDLDVVTNEDLFDVMPEYPDLVNTAEPSAVTRYDELTYNVIKVPGTADTYTVYLYCAIRPTISSTQFEGSLYSSFRRAVYHGVLHELMAMPGRPWTNDKKADYHGKQWEYFVNQARARAAKSFGRAEVAVQPRPWA